MKKSIFISGPHGSGKTTLINRLMNEYALFMENDFEIDFTHEFPSIKTMNYFERCLLRLYHRLYVGHYANELATQNPQKVVITSRSIYDSAAYIRSYREMNWITHDEADRMDSIIEHSDHTPYTIILNPKAEIIKSRLDARRAKGSRKVRDEVFNYEDTDEFVQSMWESFAAYKGDDNILYIEDNGNDEIETILAWVKNDSVAQHGRKKEHEVLSCLQASV